MIKDASLLIGATVALSGGTATPFIMLNQSGYTVDGYIGTSGVSALTRTGLSFSTKQSKVSASAPSGYTQGRSKVVATVPKILANGERTLNTISIELSVDIETTEAEVNALKALAGNLLVDTDFAAFFANQALA